MNISDLLNFKPEINFGTDNYREIIFYLNKYSYSLYEVHPANLDDYGKYASRIKLNRLSAGYGKDFLEKL